jgi:predicted SAM-dependent methyltransferase
MSILRNDELVLEIGCGEIPMFEGSIRLDIRLINGLSVVADARRLPFKDEAFDLVFSSHIIEHISHREVRIALHEWIRTIRHGGRLEVRCPDLRLRSGIFFFKGEWKDVINIYGAQDYPENYHKSGFSFPILRRLLIEEGLVRVRRIRDKNPLIPFAPVDLHVIGYKDKNQ